MSRHLTIRFANLAGTEAGAGVVGTRTVIADRPPGVAGGQGLGHSGAELFAAALGGCFWNDLHLAAADQGCRIASAGVEVEITLAGSPIRVVRARIEARLATELRAAARPVFEATVAGSTIANSVMAAVPVSFALEGDPR
jgi:organic hydroperoxide reductase OsmC/OhrA